jgi:hypothetical protein
MLENRERYVAGQQNVKMPFALCVIALRNRERVGAAALMAT